MPYVVSTLANSQNYTQYDKPHSANSQLTRPAVATRKVLIKGGAQVQGALHTPEGVLTKITDDELAFLETLPTFQLHKKGGHIKIVNREVNPDKVAADLKMDTGDTVAGERVSGGSAQLSVAKGDFEDGGRAAGVAPTVANQVVI
jgi:hypothetical protein